MDKKKNTIYLSFISLLLSLSSYFWCRQQNTQSFPRNIIMRYYVVKINQYSCIDKQIFR